MVNIRNRLPSTPFALAVPDESLMIHTLRFNRKHLISIGPMTQSVSIRIRMPSTPLLLLCLTSL